MASRVFLHVGLPKTGTTFLQTVMWANRAILAEQGVLLPGAEQSDHFWCSVVIREDPKMHQRPARAARAWDQVIADTAGWDGTAVISHEFFGAATAEQARRTVEALAPAEVHLVVTAREPLGLLTAAWQESLKFRGTTPLADFGRETPDSPHVIWNWRTLDASEVLGRWAEAVPDERVHVVTVPRAPRTLLWERFAGVVGVDPSPCRLDAADANTSMGVVEAEMLLRVNPMLDDFSTGHARSTWIRSYLAEGHLVARSGERFWPDATRVAECRDRGRAMVKTIRGRDFDVVGDVEDLLVPDELPERRTPESVTDAELAEAGVQTVAALLTDVRTLTQEARAAKAAARRAASPGRRAALARWLRE